jgi:threonine synthase
LRRLSVRKISAKTLYVWRYIQFFPYINAKNVVSLAKAGRRLSSYSETSTSRLKALIQRAFKDRGFTVLVSAVHREVKRLGGFIAEDPSGNAGASIAAHAPGRDKSQNIRSRRRFWTEI